MSIFYLLNLKWASFSFGLFYLNVQVLVRHRCDLFIMLSLDQWCWLHILLSVLSAYFCNELIVREWAEKVIDSGPQQNLSSVLSFLPQFVNRVKPTLWGEAVAYSHQVEWQFVVSRVFSCCFYLFIHYIYIQYIYIFKLCALYLYAMCCSCVDHLLFVGLCKVMCLYGTISNWILARVNSCYSPLLNHYPCSLFLRLSFLKSSFAYDSIFCFSDYSFRSHHLQMTPFSVSHFHRGDANDMLRWRLTEVHRATGEPDLVSNRVTRLYCLPQGCCGKGRYFA